MQVQDGGHSVALTQEEGEDILVVGDYRKYTEIRHSC
jgi:hypothetical protein